MYGKGNTDLIMPRWAEQRKARKKETKPRAPRRAESQPRKKRETLLEPIAKAGDLKGLARQRKVVSKKLLGRRLVDLSVRQMGRYASHARVSFRTAQRDRGPKLHAGCLTDLQEKMVVSHWTKMVRDCVKRRDLYGHKECTLHTLRALVLREEGISLGASQAGRIVKESGVQKPKSMLVQPNNASHMRSYSTDRT